MGWTHNMLLICNFQKNLHSPYQPNALLRPCSLLLAAAVRAVPISSSSPHQYRSSSGQQFQYITLEEHCIPSILASEIDGSEALALLINGTFGPTLVPELLDSGAGRLDSLNENNIRIQIINNDNFDPLNTTEASISNTAIYDEFTTVHPDRFKAFCALAMGDPNAAALELERCITQLGFLGALINAQLPNGSFFDSSAYWPVFAGAEKYNVPVYLHPAFAPNDQVFKAGGQYAAAIEPDGQATFDAYIAANLGSTAWAFESGAGLSFLRLYSAGLFDQYPSLKIILGHMGEMIPYMLERADEFLSPLIAPGRSLKEVYADNVWITTSGWFWLNQVPGVLTNTAPDRIMYSVDTPFNKNAQGSSFLYMLQTSGLVSQAEFEAIAFRNAEILFGL